MVRTINIGTRCDSSYYGVNVSTPLLYSYVIDNRPSLYTGTLTTFCITLQNANDGGTVKFRTYNVSGTTFTLNDESTTLTIPSGSGATTYTLSGQSVDVTAGNYLGACITDTTTDGLEIYYSLTQGDYMYYRGSSCANGNYPDDFVRLNGSILLHGSGVEPTSGNPPDACQDTGIVAVGSTYNGYGIIYVYSAYCTAPRYVICNLTTPWATTYNYIQFFDGTKRIYTKGSTPEEYWSVECTSIFCGTTDHGTFTECWYRDSDIYFVKKGGSDSNFGTSWTAAFASITKAANVVDQKGYVYIGYGKYTSETDITPDNIGSDPINYYIESPPDGSEWFETTLYPSEDTYGSRANPTTNYGSQTTVDLLCRNGSDIYSYGYFGFNISNLNKGLITKVEFEFEVDNLSYSPCTMYIYRVTESWDESTLTWNNRPSYDSSEVKTVTITGAVTFKVDITDLFEDETSDSFFSVVAHATVGYSNEWVDIASKEFGTDTRLYIYHDNYVSISP